MWVWGPSCLLSFSPQAWTLQSDEWRADSGHAVQCVQGSGDPSGLFRAVRPTRLRLHPPPLALRQYSHPSLSPITPSVQAFAAFSCDRYGNKKTLDFCCGFFFFLFFKIRDGVFCAFGEITIAEPDSTAYTRRMLPTSRAELGVEGTLTECLLLW